MEEQVEKETIKYDKLPDFEVLRKVDVTKYTKKRDGADYLNWAVCKDLLHQYGAKKVYFIPLTNEKGSSLFMSDVTFTDKNDVTNRCYETRIRIVIDDLEFEMQSPVMNGANPVKDNSMSQQRVWNSMCRSFVKGVAIHTGLGFDLWQKQEMKENEYEEDLSKHNIFKIAERVKQELTSKMKDGMSLEDIAKAIGLETEELQAQLSYFNTLNKLENAIRAIDTKQR